MGGQLSKAMGETGAVRRCRMSMQKAYGYTFWFCDRYHHAKVGYLATRRCGFSCWVWMQREKRVRISAASSSHERSGTQHTGEFISHPLQAQTQSERYHHSHGRVQRRNRDIQECQIQCLGRWRARQDQTALEALLYGDAGGC